MAVKPEVNGEQNLNTYIDIWYPFSVYTVTVRYKLLSELGEVSHFILKAMDSHGLTLDQIEEITNLKPCQLENIVDRLRGLGLLNDKYITPKGQMLAYIANHLHDVALELAIDRHYHFKHGELDMMLIENCSTGLQDIPPGAQLVPEPTHLRKSKLEDCFAQSERLQRRLTELLPILIPEFEEILPSLGERWGVEWDVDVRQFSKNKGLHQSLLIKPYSKAIPLEESHLTLTSPVLVLKTQFGFAEGLDWGPVLEDVPSPLISVYSEIEQRIYSEDYSLETPDEEYFLQVTEKPLNENVQVAQELIMYNNSKLTCQHQIFSKYHMFSLARQAHQYSYRELADNLNHPDLIRL